MANITAEGAALIAARVAGDFDQHDDAAIRDVLNAATEPNPTPQGTKPRTLRMAELMGLASVGTRAALLANPNLAAARADVIAQDHHGVSTWLMGYASAGIIPLDEAQAMLAYVQTPVPDPAWLAQVSWAVLNLGRPVDEQDIAAARTARGE
jgi:hypothetical protein